MHVADILKDKEAHVMTITVECPILDCAKEMKNKKVGALVVADAAGTIGGIVSERDVLHAFADKGADVIRLKVKDIMTHRERMITVTHEEHIEKVMDIMTRNRVRHVPVVEDGKLLGMISIGDLVKNRLDMVLFENEAMRKYISGF